MNQFRATVNAALPAGFVADLSFGPSVLEIDGLAGGRLLVAVDHNGPFWEAVLDIDGDQDSIELPDGPAADATDDQVAAYVRSLVKFLACLPCARAARGCLEHTCPDCGHVGPNQIDPASGELVREHACPTPSSAY